MGRHAAVATLSCTRVGECIPMQHLGRPLPCNPSPDFTISEFDHYPSLYYIVQDHPGILSTYPQIRAPSQRSAIAEYARYMKPMSERRYTSDTYMLPILEQGSRKDTEHVK